MNEYGEVTPWINQAEWDTVCSWLYSNTTSDQERGIARVTAWRARENLPFPVESTCTLCECLIREKHLSVEEGTSKQQESLRLMMGMAVTRFINGLSEYGIQQGEHGSIVCVVSKFNIPDWLVGLRHDSTHRELPTLQLLTQGVRFCYQWLWVNYWKPRQSLEQAISKRASNCINIEEDNGDVQGFHPQLSNYMIWKKLKELHSNPSLYKFKNVFRTLASASFDDFVILLNQHSFLCPMHTPGITLDNVSKDNLTSLPILPSSLYSEWSPLLNRMILYSSSIKTTIITAIISVIHNSTTDHDWVAILASWLSVLLPVEATADNSIQKSLEGSVQWKNVFDVLKSNPGYYSHPIMNICLKHMSPMFSSSTIDHILYLTALVTISERNGYNSLPLPYAAASLTHENDTSSPVAILDEGMRMEVDIQNRNEDQNTKQDKSDSINENELLPSSTPGLNEAGAKHGDEAYYDRSNGDSWIKVTNDDWYSIPLGLTDFSLFPTT